MERDPNARSGEILDDKKEKSKKKKSKVAQFISSRFSKFFREKPERAIEEETSVEEAGLTIRGKFLTLIGITRESSNTSEETDFSQDEEVHTQPGAVQRIRSALSKLNIFDSKTSESNVGQDREYVTPAETHTKEAGFNHDHPTVATTTTPEVGSGGASEGLEKKSSFFDKHERERRKQKKQNQKTEKKFKSLAREIDHQSKENEELEYELDRTQREVEKLKDKFVKQNAAVKKQTVERPDHVQVESNGAADNIPSAQFIEQPTRRKETELPISAKQESIHDNSLEPSHVIEKVQEPDKPAHTQTSIQKSVIETEAHADARENVPSPAVEAKSNDRQVQSERESLIERIINPEKQELMKSQTKNNAESMATGFSGAAASNITNHDGSESIASANEESSTKKKMLVADNVYELVAITIIILVVIVVFSLLAFTIFS